LSKTSEVSHKTKLKMEQNKQDQGPKNVQSYEAKDIQVLGGLSAVRKRFNVVELSQKIEKQGDIQALSKKFKIKPRILALAKDEGRILSQFPNLQKSKAGILSGLRTDRDLKLFAQNYDIYIAPARELIKLVRKWNNDLQKNPLHLIDQKEHDLIIGSLLGDASIRKRERNSCFRISHSIKQEAYINWKYGILRNFEFSEFYRRKRTINGIEGEIINFATKTHPVFNYYRNLFYKDNIKTIDQNMLQHLNARSLAIWICDDGSFSRTQDIIILCTNSFSLEEHKLMRDYFNKKFGLNPTIGFRDKKYFYLRFRKEDSKKLIEIIKPFIPECMKYKIGEHQK
jgi:hypothetical protein|tara:strand:+ start:34677 stop:35699 length:1023 start_codon:yes stop_codon:yes gene_type:complete